MRIISTVLAFDLGASSGRAFIGELIEGERQKLKVQEIHRFPNQVIYIDNHMYWDIVQLLQEVKTGIRKAHLSGFSPTTLGIDTWGVDFGLLDASGELLGNPYHYRDRQTDGMIEEVLSLIGTDNLYRQTGLQNMPFNTIYQLYALQKAGSVQLQAAKHLLMISDLLSYMLTGHQSNEFTMATTTQLFHPILHQWNKQLMNKLLIPDHLFSDPIQPGERIGPIKPSICAELAIPSMDVIAASHDTASAIAAIPTLGGPFAYLVCGTWNLLGTELSEPLITPDSAKLEFSNEGGVGGTHQLLKSIMGLWIIQEVKRDWEEAGMEISYAELAQRANEAPAFKSFIDPDDHIFYAPHGMVARIQTYCRKTGQPVPLNEGEVMRCVLESLALRYRHTLQQLEKLTCRSFKVLHMVGGGSQNELLCQFTANAIGRPVWVGPVEASAIGNMITQLISLGHCPDLSAGRSLVKRSFPVIVYEPQYEIAWNEAYERFIQVLD